jgi:hypothetical protein
MPQVQRDVSYITSGVSARVGQYIASVLSVPTTINTQLNTFLNTSTVPASALGYVQNATVRNNLLPFLAATVSSAALLLPDQDVEVYLGMGDGMVVGAHSFLDAASERQVTVSYADVATGGDLITATLLPTGAVNASSISRTPYFDVHKTAWFPVAAAGPPRWSTLSLAPIPNALGALPYIVTQTQVVPGLGPAVQPLVLSTTMYVTPDKYQQQFKSSAYDFRAYVIDGASLHSADLVMATAGTVNSCSTGGTVLLSPDVEEEVRVSQVSSAMDAYTLQMNASLPCDSTLLCIRPGELVLVGVGVAKTQVCGRKPFF